MVRQAGVSPKTHARASARAYVFLDSLQGSPDLNNQLCLDIGLASKTFPKVKEVRTVAIRWVR